MSADSVDAFNDPALAVVDRLDHLASLIGLGATDVLHTPLSRMATDADIGAADRLEAVEALDEVDPTAGVDLLTKIAADDALPGDVCRDAATQLLNLGERDTASGLLRRVGRRGSSDRCSPTAT